MTEEIIIDGVNVAGCCKCYNVEQKILCGASGICANNPNCYYKQLKRLEQENKELKEFCVELERQKQKQHMQWFKRCTEINARASQHRFALEEINITVKQLLQGVSSNCINNTPYLTALSLIETKINEVLENDK